MCLSPLDQCPGVGPASWGDLHERNFSYLLFCGHATVGDILALQLTCCLPQVYVLLSRWNTPLWILIVGSKVNDLLRQWHTPLWVLSSFYNVNKDYFAFLFHIYFTFCYYEANTF
jgi:hypothetical protein